MPPLIERLGYCAGATTRPAVAADARPPLLDFQVARRPEPAPQRQHFIALRRIFSKVCEKSGMTLVALDGETDHVPLLVNFPPQVKLSRLVNRLKGRVEPAFAARVPRDRETLLGGRPAEPELLRRELRRGSPRSHQAVHRTAAHPSLKLKVTPGIESGAALRFISRPER